MNETIDTELWSTIDIALGVQFPVLSFAWFDYGLSQQVTGGVRVATQADTNIPRTGHSGLQPGWRMAIRQWRARAVGPSALLRSDDWWSWCATVYVELVIHRHNVATWTLDELLRAPRLRAGITSPGTFVIPIELRENFHYHVRLTPTVGGQQAERARIAAVTARPEYAVLPSDLWEPLKLRCYLRGDLTMPTA